MTRYVIGTMRARVVAGPVFEAREQHYLESGVHKMGGFIRPFTEANYYLETRMLPTADAVKDQHNKPGARVVS